MMKTAFTTSWETLDCDVEEPNAHLFLKGTGCEEEEITIPVPEVDETLCDACGRRYGPVNHSPDRPFNRSCQGRFRRRENGCALELHGKTCCGLDKRCGKPPCEDIW